MPGNPSTVRRVAAGLALIIAPTLFLLADIISPAWSDDTAQHVQQVDENPGRQGVYGLLSVLGFTLLVPGIIGIVHLIRGPGMTLAHIGGGLAVIGFGAGPALAGSGVTDAVAVDTIGPEAYTVLLEGLQENAAWILLVLLIAIPSLLAVILMAMAVWRSGLAPRWIGALPVVGVVLIFPSTSQILGIVSDILLLAWCSFIGSRMLQLSDQAWDHPPHHWGEVK